MTESMIFLENGIDEGSWGGQAACVGYILPLNLTGKTKQQTGKLTICIFLLQGIPLGLIHSVPLVLGKKEVKKPKLWPYHKYHKYHDIKGDHHTNINISIICTTVVKGVLRRASKVLHLLLPVLHEIALGSPGWLDLCCKVLQLSDIQNRNMPIALL